MARIQSFTLEQMNLTLHRVRGELHIDELRRTAKRFYDQAVTLNVLWDFAGADLARIPSDDLNAIVSEVRAYTHSRAGGRTAFVVSAEVNFGLGRMVEMLSTTMDMPFQFRSFRSLEQAAGWLDVDPAAIRKLFQDE